MDKELLNQLVAWAKDTAQLVSAELPELGKQIVMWQTAEAAGYVLFGLVLLAFAYRMAKWWPNTDSESIESVLSGFGAGIGGVLGVILLVTNFFDLLKCLTAPKLVLIDYVLQMTTASCR